MIDEWQDLRRSRTNATVADKPDDQRQHRGVDVVQPPGDPLIHAVGRHRGDRLSDRHDNRRISRSRDPQQAVRRGRIAATTDRADRSGPQCGVAVRGRFQDRQLHGPGRPSRIAVGPEVDQQRLSLRCQRGVAGRR